MYVINLTPHAINLTSGSEVREVPPSGMVARVSMTRETVGAVEVDGITVPIFRAIPGEVSDLPPPRQGMVFIVSRLVAEACRERDDLLVPDELVRDEEGRVIGARALARVS